MAIPDRVMACLTGLAVGDAFGETFFVPVDPLGRVASRTLAPAPWRWTDDTAMALGLVEVLAEHGHVDTDRLAAVFARNYVRDPRRGYGGGAHDILSSIAAGMTWRTVSRGVFGGQGSMGNGAAMRVAPLGAWFADDLARVREEALRSAQPTHAHLEGAAGAVAVAVATAVAATGGDVDAIWDAVLDLTPGGETRDGIAVARALPAETSVRRAANVLGVGYRVTSPDTVPFVMWAATRRLDSYEEALWLTVEGLGDRDTTCAMVGGILGARHGNAAIPVAWRASTEAWRVPL